MILGRLGISPIVSARERCHLEAMRILDFPMERRTGDWLLVQAIHDEGRYPSQA
jgi:hypothetical protein